MTSARILVVDDNEATRYVLGRVLRQAGYEVMEAASGGEALGVVRREHPDLVVLDVKLPDISGLEVCQRIKTDPDTAFTLVLQMSASFVRMGDTVRGLDNGADTYLTEPVEPPVLLATVKALLRIRQAEAALRESEARYRRLFEENPLPTWVSDAETHRILIANAAAVEQYGYTREEFLGMQLDDLHGGGQAAAGGERAATGLVSIGQHLTRAGAEIAVEVTSAPIVFGARPAQLVIARNITQQRRVEEMRAALLSTEQEARKHAEAANRAKDEFLAMLGHELRNPLGAVRNALSIIDRAGEDAQGTARALAVATRQIDHLRRMVDDLLDVARLMTGKIALKRGPIDLAEAVGQAVASLESDEKSRGRQLVVEREPVWVAGDSTRIEQIVVNLTGNALKYTPPGGQVHLSVHQEGGSAVFRVRDTGEGIPGDLLPRIFDTFVQGVRSLDRVEGGLGIGLTIVRRLVELHGGTIEAESEGPGRGSTFTVRLPVVSVPTSPHPVPTVQHAAHRLILIIEDNHDSREMLRHLLELEGHEVHEAEDGPGGVEAALRLRPDVALVDVGLPGLDGYEVARRIRGGGDGDVYLVALTGYGLPEHRQRSQEAGFDSHLVKPVAPEILSRVLRHSPSRRDRV